MKLRSRWEANKQKGRSGILVLVLEKTRVLGVKLEKERGDRGKRAVADHVNAAVGFIKDTETRIKELSARRDELSGEQTCQRSDPDLARTGFELGKSDPASLIVQPCVNGFEVAVSSNSSGPDALPLSRVLEALQELGLEVINSLTTRVNERLMHTIQVEVNTFGCLDLAWLQQKLVEDLILSPGY
ncbi:hypothetical protein F2Q68_00040368 [Brassica cretica]|uniref:Uncharacterized protein n=1 Tax=Brassica cretica TaxID=69181 RepID=A0A8S9MFQ6_BRACR|nr:hypothetical protein F2Q68_00040368 [Brassica cretica]